MPRATRPPRRRPCRARLPCPTSAQAEALGEARHARRTPPARARETLHGRRAAGAVRDMRTPAWGHAWPRPALGLPVLCGNVRPAPPARDGSAWCGDRWGASLREALAPPSLADLSRPLWCTPAQGCPSSRGTPPCGETPSQVSRDFLAWRVSSAVLPPAPLVPNASLQLLPEAGATQERRLEAVSCKALFGAVYGYGCYFRGRRARLSRLRGLVPSLGFRGSVLLKSA